jgi:chemotaxis protein MotB
MTVVAGALCFFGYRMLTAREQELKAQRAQLDETATALTNALASVQTDQHLIALLKKQVSDLEREKELVGQAAKSLEDQMRERLESKDVTISKLQGKLTVTIVDRVMFDSGEAILKPDGAVVMQKIADLLAANSQLQIHVVGHTDNVPIRQTAQSRFASNWELSTARALAAVHYLVEKAGVDPRRLSAVGCGEYRPVADNATAEGRAKNRRITITILPEAFLAGEEGTLRAPASATGTAIGAAEPKPQ